MTLHDLDDTRLVADLRRQLDSAYARLGRADRDNGNLKARVIELERYAAEQRQQYEELRDRFVGVAAEASVTEVAEKRGAVWWMTVFCQANRHRVELSMLLTQRETWLREQGQESTRLQRELTAAQTEIGKLERRIAEAEHDLDEALKERSHG